MAISLHSESKTKTKFYELRTEVEHRYMLHFLPMCPKIVHHYREKFSLNFVLSFFFLSPKKSQLKSSLKNLEIISELRQESFELLPACHHLESLTIKSEWFNSLNMLTKLENLKDLELPVSDFIRSGTSIPENLFFLLWYSLCELYIQKPKNPIWIATKLCRNSRNQKVLETWWLQLCNLLPFT